MRNTSIFNTLIILILLFNTSSIIAQEIILLQPNDESFCTSASYTYVAQLEQATNFCWTVENPLFSPQPEFTIYGAKNDTIDITWFVPGMFQDILNFHVLTVIAKNGDTPIDTLLITIENVIDAPSPLPSQQITQESDTIACSNMTTVISYAYPTSTHQEFTATLEPAEAGQIISYSQWPPLQDPINTTNIYWSESFSGAATATITTSNNCGTDVKEYHYFKESNVDNPDVDYYFFGQDTICEYKTTYIITDSTDVLVDAVSIIPIEALDLVISRDSFFFINGSAVATKYIDVYWNSDYSGAAQLLLHKRVECDASNALINNFATTDIFKLSICEEITATNFINHNITAEIATFPNPINAGNTVYFDTKLQLPAHISVIEVSSGKTVQEGVLSNVNHGFNLSSQIPSGLYLIKISLDNSPQQFYSKLIIQK